jgi:hypothetical protein
LAKVILHAGFHKTGTTAIQEFARKNRRALRAAGIYYPAYPDWAPTEATEHHDFAHAIAGRSQVFDDERSVRRLVDEWLAAAGPDETILISAEAMSRHLGRDRDASWGERRRKYVRKLARLFAGHDAEIVAVLRRQDDFVRSLYFEHIRGAIPRGRLTFSRYRRRASRSWMRFEENLQIYSEFFPVVNVVIYEDLVQTGDLCGRFFHQLGADLTEPKTVSVVRKSLNPVQAELKRVLNRRLKRGAVNDRILSWLNSDDVIATLDRHCDTENSSPWESAEVRRQYVHAFDAENRRIRDRYLPGRKTLFPEFTPDGREGNVVRLGNEVFADLLVSELARPAPPVRRPLLERLLARTSFLSR